MLENITRRAAIGLIGLGLASFIACEGLNPAGPSGTQYGADSDGNLNLPNPNIRDPLAGIGKDRKLFFFRMDGTYLGVVNYQQAERKEKEPEYSVAKLKQLNVNLDVKIDKYYAILEEPEPEKVGKVIVKPTLLVDKKERFLEVPSKKVQERQWYCYFMSEKLKEDDKSYLNALKWKDERDKKKVEAEPRQSQEF